MLDFGKQNGRESRGMGNDRTIRPASKENPEFNKIAISRKV